MLIATHIRKSGKATCHAFPKVCNTEIAAREQASRLLNHCIAYFGKVYVCNDVEVKRLKNGRYKAIGSYGLNEH